MILNVWIHYFMQQPAFRTYSIYISESAGGYPSFKNPFFFHNGKKLKQKLCLISIIRNERIIAECEDKTLLNVVALSLEWMALFRQWEIKFTGRYTVCTGQAQK